ncbi:MAG: glycosyltransferase family 4 protein [Planctomycetes bacterium]|nr:glycosyltransferase family 4 protein [Planctomycetota bacterium]
MKVLHLLSNFKWTGPAEPALTLAAEMRALGVEVEFACGRPPRGARCDVAMRARERGVEPVERFRLSKHFRFLGNVADALALRDFIAERGVTVVHAHQQNDHLVGGAAARRAGRVGVVRTVYDGEPLPRGPRNRLLFQRLTDAAFVVSARVRQDLADSLNFPPGRLFPAETPVDPARFDPARALPDVRARLGLAPHEFLAGIVARVQRHRRWDRILKALHVLKRRGAPLRFLVIGRGTHEQEILTVPAHDLGLSTMLLHPGYLTGDDYVAALRALDLKLFLVPGSDGTCRAAREAMTLGVPVFAARRGMLPEMIADGVTGRLLARDEAGDLVDALLWALDHRDCLRDMGAAARQTALERYNPARVARAVLAVYERLAPAT